MMNVGECHHLVEQGDDRWCGRGIKGERTISPGVCANCAAFEPVQVGVPRPPRPRSRGAGVYVCLAGIHKRYTLVGFDILRAAGEPLPDGRLLVSSEAWDRAQAFRRDDE